ELARRPESRKQFPEEVRGRILSSANKSKLFAGIHQGWRERFKARRDAYRRTRRFPKARKSDPWIPEEEKLLPKLSTAELVPVIGRSFKSIQAHRYLLGLRARPPAARLPWRDSEIRLLGTAPDRIIAKRLGRSVYSVENKRTERG